MKLSSETLDYLRRQVDLREDEKCLLDTVDALQAELAASVKRLEDYDAAKAQVAAFTGAVTEAIAKHTGPTGGWLVSPRRAIPASVCTDEGTGIRGQYL